MAAGEFDGMVDRDMHTLIHTHGNFIASQSLLHDPIGRWSWQSLKQTCMYVFRNFAYSTLHIHMELEVAQPDIHTCKIL